MSGTVLIKNYFEANGGRKVEIAEMRALKPEDRTELADLAAKELGLTKTQTDKGPDYV